MWRQLAHSQTRCWSLHIAALSDANYIPYAITGPGLSTFIIQTFVSAEVTENALSTKSSGLLRLPVHEIASIAGFEQEMLAALILPAPSTLEDNKGPSPLFRIVLPRATVIVL